MFLNFFCGKFIKGPPEAVITIFSTSVFFELFNNDQIEKCSESTGINFVLFLISSFCIKFQPQIIDSLLAIATVLLNLMQSNVGFKPAKPVIEHIV